MSLESITLSAAEQALSFLSPDVDRREWSRIGKALQDEFGDAAFSAWDSWSQGSKSYDEKDSKSTWASLSRMNGGSKPVGIGTLIYLAQQAGWKKNASHVAKRTPEESERLTAEREARREAARIAEDAVNALAAAAALALWNDAVPAPSDHPYLKRKGVLAHTLRHTDDYSNDYTDDKGRIVHRNVKNALLIPIWAAPGKLSSLQAIFPTSDNALKRDKDYLTGGRKHGCYFLIGRITAETTVVVVCEGYATGASLHEATGHPVMVAFDASNLIEVAKMARLKMPEAAIVLAADNDQYHENGRNGGIESATAAARECKGVVAVPQFVERSTKPKDFNDLARLHGLPIVAEHIAAAINRPTPAPAPAAPDESPFGGEPALIAGEPAAAQSGAPADAAKASGKKKAKAEGAKPHAPLADSALDHIERSQKDFKILGYDHERYYFFQNERKQVMVLTKGDFTDAGLIELSRVNWWERTFPGTGNTTIDKKAAINWMVVCAAKKGVYDMTRVRGRGGYLDAGRFVFHHGAYLSVDGEIVDMTKVENSRYVYELAPALPPPAEESLTSDEGERLLDLAKSFRWTKGGSGALLAGWVALAPICGALKWRPHIWITGGAGSGKSTIVNEFVNPLCAGVNIFAQGSSSEAGIRQTLGTDARPVIYDEAEQNDQRDQSRVQAILALARQASTESQAKTLKGSAGGEAQAFHIRSMFCMSSVQVGLKQQADVERIAILNVKSKRDDSNSVAKWEELQAALLAIQLDTTLPQRLLRRSMNQFHTTIKAITVFSKVAAEHFGSVRDGDQYGTLLAGAWSLISTDVPSAEQARDMLQSYDWTEHMESSDSDESERAKSAWLEAHVRMAGGIEVTVYEMIKAACGRAHPGEPLAADGAAKASDLLLRYGMRITKGDEFILLSNTSQELKGLIPDIADLRGLLLRLPGASRYENTPVRFNGSASKCIAIPLHPILIGDATDEQ